MGNLLLGVLGTSIIVNACISFAFVAMALMDPYLATASCDIQVPGCGMGPVGTAIGLVADAGNQINSIWGVVGFTYNFITQGFLAVIQILGFWHPQLRGSTVGDFTFYGLIMYGAIIWITIIITRVTSRN